MSNMVDLQIVDSSLMEKKQIAATLFADNKTSEVVINRSYGSLMHEWATHKLLYKIGLWKSRTKDCDFNYPQTFLEKVGYAVFGSIAMLIVK